MALTYRKEKVQKLAEAMRLSYTIWAKAEEEEKILMDAAASELARERHQMHYQWLKGRAGAYKEIMDEIGREFNL